MRSGLLRFGVWALVFSSCFVLGSSLVGFKHKNKYVWSDTEGYYMYLPAVFFYGSFENLPVRSKGEFKPWPGTNRIFTKYTYGVALMEAPFFGAAYLTRVVRGIDPKDYQGNEYSIALLAAGCFYATLGLFVVFRALRRHFDPPWPAVLTVAILLTGTNLLFYAVRAPAMSHAYSFFLASLLVWLTPTLYERPSYAKYLLAGAALGVLIVIRPTNAVMVLYPLLYGVAGAAQARQRLRFLSRHRFHIVAALAPVLLAWLPQLYYWHHVTGHWLLYSYQGEGFDYWTNPQIGQVLFSRFNGWLLYNPVMVFSLVGIVLLLRNNRLNSWGVLAVLCSATYLFASWWSWWFGTAYGNRSYVELLPILAAPLCFVVSRFLRARPIAKWAGLTLLALLCYYNFRLTLLHDWSWSETGPDFRRVLAQVFFLNPS